MKRGSMMTWMAGVILAALILSGCSSKNPMAPDPYSYGGGVPGTGGPGISTNLVAISGYAFSPTPLTINLGSSVYWKNNDGMTHTATADIASAFQFNTGNIPGGGAMSTLVVFTQAGTFPYHCAIHGGMTGSIIVQ